MMMLKTPLRLPPHLLPSVGEEEEEDENHEVKIIPPTTLAPQNSTAELPVQQGMPSARDSPV